MELVRIAKLSVAVSFFVGGILFLLNNFGVITGDMTKYWPLIFIIVGGVMLYEYFLDRRPQGQGGNGLW